MPNRIILKRSSVAAKTPVAADLSAGELAINLSDKRLFSKDGSGNIINVTVDASHITTGTLADARIASAATWNAKEPGIAAGTTAQYWRGDKSWQTLNSTAVGLGNVENKSSATIRGEITSANVTTALGFTPYNATNPNGYITSSSSISGNAATASTSSLLTSSDIRTLAPSSGTAGRALFGFTSWSNNNTAPWADYLLLRSYTDASGQNDNLVMFRKDTIGMRIWQQSWGSSTAFATYKDVAFTDGTGASGTWGISITGSAASITGTYGGTLTSSQVTSALGYTPYNAGANTVLTSANYGGYSTFSGVVTSGSGFQTSAYAANARNRIWSFGNADAYGLSYFQGTAGYAGTSTDTLGIHFGTATAANSQFRFNQDGTFNATGAITQAGNQVLHAGNYTSYSPSLTGTGASGTWGISITGNAATLTGYDWFTYGKNIRATQYYCDDWFRNYNSGTGLYNQATANHFYSDGQYWNIAYSGTQGLRFRNGHAGTVLGYLYAETSGNFGLLHNGGGWAVQVYPGGGGNLVGTWTVGGNTPLTAANYTSYNGILRALGGSDGTDFNTLGGNHNSMYYAYIANSANRPSSYNYAYGTILTFSPGQGTAGQAQMYISHAGNDLCFRGGWNNNSWQTWNRVLTDQNYSSYALPLSGGTTSGHVTFNSTTTFNYSPTVNAYLNCSQWFNITGGAGYGLYGNGTNGAHFYLNSGSYGPWKVLGTRNGWGGIEFGSNSNGDVSLMIGTSSNVSGFHNNSYGWHFRWESGTLYCHKNTYGGGTQATVLDSSNWSSYVYASSLGLGSGNNVTFNAVSDAIGNLRTIVQNYQTAAYTLTATDSGKHIRITTGGVTVPNGVFSAGQAITIYNDSGSNQTITQGASVTMYLGGTATTGNRTLAQRGVATLLCIDSSTFVISGAGLT